MIAHPIGSITDAITIRTTPHEVWPWLVQMGGGRAGWYSYDVVDNRGHRSADSIVPAFQAIRTGDVLPAVPGATDAFEVLQFEPEASLVLGWRAPGDPVPVTTWAFVLERRGPNHTRLIERGRVRSPYRPFGLPEWIARWLAPLAHRVMVRKHLRGIARRSERSAGTWSLL
ncbi:MAG TPA: hypothetical protein VI653_08115 [Steroidobacteraceae bacterium]